MRILIWSPVVIALVWAFWDWGRVRYLRGRTDTFDEIVGFLLEKDEFHIDRIDLVVDLMKFWEETIPAFVDPKVYPVPKHKWR